MAHDPQLDRLVALKFLAPEAAFGRAAERLTRESGDAWFWSRSRQELWHKGATSGNTLRVVELRDDCDEDALLLRVEPNGPACHTGSVSCFAPELWRKSVGSESASSSTSQRATDVIGSLSARGTGSRAVGCGSGRSSRPAG